MSVSVVQGLYFHSSKDFKNVVSGEEIGADFKIETHLGELLGPQRFPSLAIGSTFFLEYPIRTRLGNRLVVGKGKVVPTLQKERKGGLKVPFVHYFAIDFSEVLKNQIDPSKLLAIASSEYADVFRLTEEGQDLGLKTLTLKVNQLLADSGKNLPDCKDVQSYFGLEGPKGKFYYNSVEEGLQVMQCLMRSSPNITKWSFSTIVTPLDAEYPERIALVYGQEGRRVPQPPTNEGYLDSLRSVDPRELTESFTEFISRKMKLALNPADALGIVDKLSLEELQEDLDEFLRKNHKKGDIHADLQQRNMELINRLDQMGKSTSVTQDEWRQLNGALDEYQMILADARPFISGEEFSKLSIPAERIAESLKSQNLHEILKFVEDNPPEVVTEAPLRIAIEPVVQKNTDEVSNFWRMQTIDAATIDRAYFLMTSISIGKFNETGMQVLRDEALNSKDLGKTLGLLRNYADKTTSIWRRVTRDDVRCEYVLDVAQRLEAICSFLYEWLKSENPTVSLMSDEQSIATTSFNLEQLKLFLTEFAQNYGKCVKKGSVDKNVREKLNQIIQFARSHERKALEEKQSKELVRLSENYKKFEGQFENRP
jgi:hypothetical protein